MILVYVDESFNRDEFWVTGLVVPGTALLGLEAALDAVVLGAADAYGGGLRAELHGYDIAQGRGDWASMAGMLRARLDIYRQALEAVHDATSVRAYLYGLDRHRHRSKYIHPWPERQVLLGHLAQRVNGLVPAGECALLIVDDSPTQDQIREHIRDFKRNGTLSRINNRPLTRLADTVYFAPSHHSRLLQAADLISYLHLRQRPSVAKASGARAAAAAKDLWSIVSPACTPNLWQQ